MIIDAIYAAAESTKPDRLPNDGDVALAGRAIRRFLSELPGELTIAEIRVELAEPE